MIPNCFGSVFIINYTNYGLDNNEMPNGGPQVI